MSDEPIILSRCCPTCERLTAENAALRSRLAEAEALLTEVRDEGFDYWRDRERANRIDAHLASQQ